MTDQTTLLEVEVKFWAADLTAVRHALTEAGATLGNARYYERNVIYDTPEKQLRQRDQIIRLRQDQRTRLTFKGPPPAELAVESEVKMREEIEVELSDLGRMELILTRLGFTEQKIYEKYRESWHFAEIEIVLDEMPFGHFVELEGSESAIKALAHTLGLNWESRLSRSYWSLMDELKQRYNLPFNDITFELFADIACDPQTLWG